VFNYITLKAKNGEPVHGVAKSQKCNAYVCSVSLRIGKFKPEFLQHYNVVNLSLVAQQTVTY
jgi:hypothetical protein